jgi:hypothetical protein
MLSSVPLGSPDALLATGAARYRINNTATDSVVIDTSSNFNIGPTQNAVLLRGNCWNQPFTTQMRFRRSTGAPTFMTFVPNTSGDAGIRVWGNSNRAGLHSAMYIQNSPLLAVWNASGTGNSWSVDSAGLAVMRLDAGSGGIGMRFTFDDPNFRVMTGAEIAASARFGLGAFTSGPRQRVMTGGTTAGVVTSAITVNNTSCEFVNLSDYRRKTNIEPMVDAVGTVKRLRPVWYNLRGFENDPPYSGFIAHEFQEVIRDGVTGYRDEVNDDGEPVYQLMDKRTAIPALVGAVQELRQRIATARERLETLKGNN